MASSFPVAGSLLAFWKAFKAVAVAFPKEPLAVVACGKYPRVCSFSCNSFTCVPFDPVLKLLVSVVAAGTALGAGTAFGAGAGASAFKLSRVFTSSLPVAFSPLADWYALIASSVVLP